MNIHFTQAAKRWQQEVIDAADTSHLSHKTYVVKSARQRGKSFCINRISLKLGLMYRGTVLIVEPTIAQCRRMYKSMYKALAGTLVIHKSNETTLTITLCNGTEIIYKSAEQKDNLRGYVVDIALFIDECAYISQDVIEILLPCTTVHKAPTFVFSTPLFATGWFYNQFQRGMDPNESTIKSFDWTDTEKYDFADFISQEDIEYYRKIYSSQKFETEILGHFISGKSFIFGDFSKCIKKPVDQEIVSAGIDWGTGSDNDSTVMTFMNRHREVVRIWETNHMNPTQQIEEIAKQINSIPTLTKVKVEMNSIGQVYYDMLLSKLNNKSLIIKFYTSNESKREIIENLIQAFGTETIGIIADENLSIQLSVYSMESTRNGSVTYNAPAGYHDDYVISLALCYDCFAQPNTGSFGFTRR